MRLDQSIGIEFIDKNRVSVQLEIDMDDTEDSDEAFGLVGVVEPPNRSSVNLDTQSFSSSQMVLEKHNEQR